MFKIPELPDNALDVSAKSRSSRTTTVESLLVMLSLAPMTGYQIRLTIQRTIGNFWQESFGQIYPALRRMEAEGLIAGAGERASENGNGSGRTYSLTDKGRRRLREWMELPCERQVMRDELLLKIFSGIDAPRGSLARHVREFREKVLEDLKRYREIEKRLPVAQKGNPALPFYLLTLKQGFLKADALVRWSDEALVELGRLDKERSGKKKAGPKQKKA